MTSMKPTPTSVNGPVPPSIISADMRIVGDLSSTGEIQIEGNLEGNVQAKSITLSKGGSLSGEVTADEVVIHGRITGKIHGKKVKLSSSSQVEGDIINETLTIEEGAMFSGNISKAAAANASSGGRPSVVEAVAAATNSPLAAGGGMKPVPPRHD